MKYLRGKTPVSLIVACASLIITTSTFAKAPENPSGFKIQHGINLSHWLSQDFGWAPRQEWITERDIQYIASLGFDHVRLPIDEIELWKEDGTPVADAFALIEEALGWCQKNKLRVVLDLHTVRAHHFNAADTDNGKNNTLWKDPAEQEKFIGLWRQISGRLKEYPNSFLAYEIMNEPTAEDPEDWNKLINKSVEFIRSVEPERVILMGANMWQIPSCMPLLKVPEGDKNIILSFHTYEPLLLTHHTANWVDGPIQTYKGPVNYPGAIIDMETFNKLAPESEGLAHPLDPSYTEEWGPERFLQLIQPAIAKAKEMELQLYCGEFGCLPSVPRKARLAYYRDIIGVFESQDIAWAPWEYKGDFGIYEWHGLPSLTGAPDIELLDAMFQR